MGLRTRERTVRRWRNCHSNKVLELIDKEQFYPERCKTVPSRTAGGEEM